MRGAAPVGGGDGEALGRELAPGGDIVEQAGHGDPPVGPRFDIARDERGGTRAAPFAISGGASLGDGVAANAIGAERGEGTGRAKIGRDDFGDLAAERLGRALRGGHGGDGDGLGGADAAADDFGRFRLVLRLGDGRQADGGHEKCEFPDHFLTLYRSVVSFQPPLSVSYKSAGNRNGAQSAKIRRT